MVVGDRCRLLTKCRSGRAACVVQGGVGRCVQALKCSGTMKGLDDMVLLGEVEVADDVLRLLGRAALYISCWRPTTHGS